MSHSLLYFGYKNSFFVSDKLKQRSPLYKYFCLTLVFPLYTNLTKAGRLIFAVSAIPLVLLFLHPALGFPHTRLTGAYLWLFPRGIYWNVIDDSLLLAPSEVVSLWFAQSHTLDILTKQAIVDWSIYNCDFAMLILAKRKPAHTGKCFNSILARLVTLILVRRNDCDVICQHVSSFLLFFVAVMCEILLDF